MGRRTNYERGADKERRIVNMFKEQGDIAFRSAGSHSPIDVVVINSRTHKISLIQSKLHGKDNLSKPERNRIMEEGRKLNGNYYVEFKLWE